MLIDGEDITGLTFDDALEVRQKMGMVFQGAALFDSMTVFENIAYPLREHTDLRRGRDRAPRAREAASSSISSPNACCEQLPSELSGGMRKRVGIARGMANNPEIMLYDEPTSGLDPLTTGTITRLIIKLQRELGVTSVVVSHDIRSVFRMASNVALLAERRIRFFGTPEEMAASDDDTSATSSAASDALPTQRASDMKRRSIITWDQLRVGGVIVVSLAILGVGGYKLGEAANLFAKRYELRRVPAERERSARRRRGDGRRPARRHHHGDRVPPDRRRHDAQPARSSSQLDETLQRAGPRRLARARSARWACSATRCSTSRRARRATRALAAGDTIVVAPSLDYDQIIAAGVRRGRRRRRADARTCAASPAASSRARARSGSW